MANLPTFLKTWDQSKLNQRISYVSVADALGSFFYAIKNYWVATLGGTTWGSCDGTTGDNTDRWSSKANVATLGASTGAANSWWVGNMPNGAQFCLSYVGASADIGRISYSPGGLFTLAGTHTFTPTATDECIVHAGTLVDPTTSADRVYFVQGTTDRTMLRAGVFRQNTLVSCFFIERIVEGPGIATGVLIGGNSTVIYNGSSMSTAGVQFGGAWTNNNGTPPSLVSYLNGVKLTSMGFGSVSVKGAVTMIMGISDIPWPINGGYPPFPVWIFTTLANNSGWLGTRIDAFAFFNSTTATSGQYVDDVAQGTRVMLIGTLWTPWDTAQGLTTT